LSVRVLAPVIPGVDPVHATVPAAGANVYWIVGVVPAHATVAAAGVRLRSR
jgi:hypothetical protein